MRRALLVAGLALVLVPAASASGDPARGKALFEQGCSACHGLDARGIRNRGPDLHDAGAASADFYLSTGRMPLDHPGDQPLRAKPAYPQRDINDLVAYVGSLGGPPVPDVEPAQGSLSEGQQLFTENCAGCHQELGRGGVVTGALAPILLDATPRQVAEAIRIGPYVMPSFGPGQLDDRQVASIARYVLWTRHPENPGGWALFNIGPVPEGLVTWLIAALALVLLIRVLGERSER